MDSLTKGIFLLSCRCTENDWSRIVRCDQDLCEIIAIGETLSSFEGLSYVIPENDPCLFL